MRIYVLDIETTGLDGLEYGDKVLEVGVASLDMDKGLVVAEYRTLVACGLTERDRGAWVFSNSSLDPEDFDCGILPSPEEVGDQLRRIARDPASAWTAYNSAFDFGRFLRREPYRFSPRAAPCIMEMYMEAEGLDRWAGAWTAYRDLCPEDPAGIGGAERHRALDDARMEAHLLKAMCARWPWVEDAYRRSAL